MFKLCCLIILDRGTAGTLGQMERFRIFHVPQHLGDVASGKALLSYCSQRQQVWLCLWVEELWHVHHHSTFVSCQILTKTCNAARFFSLSYINDRRWIPCMSAFSAKWLVLALGCGSDIRNY